VHWGSRRTVRRRIGSHTDSCSSPITSALPTAARRFAGNATRDGASGKDVYPGAHPPSIPPAADNATDAEKRRGLTTSSQHVPFAAAKRAKPWSGGS